MISHKVEMACLFENSCNFYHTPVIKIISVYFLLALFSYAVKFLHNCNHNIQMIYILLFNLVQGKYSQLCERKAIINIGYKYSIVSRGRLGSSILTCRRGHRCHGVVALTSVAGRAGSFQPIGLNKYQSQRPPQNCNIFLSIASCYISMLSVKSLLMPYCKYLLWSTVFFLLLIHIYYIAICKNLYHHLENSHLMLALGTKYTLDEQPARKRCCLSRDCVGFRPEWLSKATLSV